MTPDENEVPVTTAFSNRHRSSHHSDCVVIGGGVMGLSIAYELSGRGAEVCMVQHQPVVSKGGRQASWAGAGIIPPANRSHNAHFAEHLHRLSYDLHLEWAASLKSETGIDNGLNRCGGIYIARTQGEAAALVANLQMYDLQNIRATALTPTEVASQEPALAEFATGGNLKAALVLPDELQIRNPRHLKALRAACELRGVRFVEFASDCEATPHWQLVDSVIESVQVGGHEFVAANYCVAAGAWSLKILSEFEAQPQLFPMRGQILLFDVPASERFKLSHIINEGPRYIVPRGDGRFLVGSLEEEAGFDNRPTDRGLDDLMAFATGICPQFHRETLIDHWSGLRPATLDGNPYVGRLSRPENLYYATGHYRSGLTMSTGTARVISQWIFGEEPEIDISGLQLHRGL